VQTHADMIQEVIDYMYPSQPAAMPAVGEEASVHSNNTHSRLHSDGIISQSVVGPLLFPFAEPFIGVAYNCRSLYAYGELYAITAYQICGLTVGKTRFLYSDGDAGDAGKEVHSGSAFAC